MNIFADQHHFSLFNSLRLLFEQRLGGQLYHPIGREWLSKGYWRMANIYNSPERTIELYLGLRGRVIEDGIYEMCDTNWNGCGCLHKGIVLQRFFTLPIDIVIASIPEHIEPFRQLCQEHFNHPKLIFQVGNCWTVQEGYHKNLMASAIIDNVPLDTNLVTYHQEFDLKVFHYEEPQQSRNIYSFLNCLRTAQHYQNDWLQFQALEHSMPTWNFKSYGGSCRDGAVCGITALANKMREARFLWHLKAGGDGYGHIVFNSGAVGRPLITKLEYYKGKLGAALMKDEQTCIAVDGLDIKQVRDKIEYFNEPLQYNAMCRKIYENFCQVVDFNQEEVKIRQFLNKLK